MYHATAAERREFEAGPVPELMPQFGRRQVASVVGAANVAAVSPSTALSWPWGRVAHRRLAPPPGFEPGPSEPKSEVLPLHHGGSWGLVIVTRRRRRPCSAPALRAGRR